MADEVRIPVGDIVTGWGESVGARRVRVGKMPEEVYRHLLAGGKVILTGCPPARIYGHSDRIMTTDRIVVKKGRYWVTRVPTKEEKEVVDNPKMSK